MQRYRNSDPPTSALAAEHVEQRGIAAAQKELVRRAVARFPGLTSFELAQASGIDRYVVARRLPEVEREGWVRRATPRKCEISDRMALTWEPSEPGDPAEQGMLF